MKRSATPRFLSSVTTCSQNLISRTMRSCLHAAASAMRLMAELLVLPEDMRAPQWVAHAGLDPRPLDSGTSIHKTRRIIKVGNRYLRAALHMPALVAIQR